MNQETPFENNEQFYDVPVRKNAKYYRGQAWKSLMPVFWITILATLIASFLGVFSGGIGYNFNISFNSSGLDEAESEDIEMTWEEFSQELQPYLTDLKNGDISAIFDRLDAQTGQGEILLSAVVIVILIFVLLALLIDLAIRLFVIAPVKIGYNQFLLAVVDKKRERITIPTLFRTFKLCYWKSVKLELLHSLILFATSIPSMLANVGAVIYLIVQIDAIGLVNLSVSNMLLPLLIFSSIIIGAALLSIVIQLPVSYMFGFAHTILADYPTVGALEALRNSRAMMRGNKWRLFCLDFSFIGWELLALLFTCGLGMYFVTPYHYLARTHFYHDISGRTVAQETEFPSLNPDDYTQADNNA